MPRVESIQGLPHEVRIELVRALGYATDGEFVLDEKTRRRYKDPCTGDSVRLDNMLVLKGSTIILDDNPVSLDWYMDRYPGRL